MNWWILAAGAALLVLFVWSWIGLTMVRHLSLARRVEKLLHIDNPLPEEERELSHLMELQSEEGGKVRSAKMILLLFMAVILGAVVYAVINPTFRALLGMDTMVQSIWVGVLIVGFFCMPTYFGLNLASFRVKGLRVVTREKTEDKAEPKPQPKAPEPKPAPQADEKAQTA